MPEINTILTVMAPTGLVCGTLIDLVRDEMEFEMAADFPLGFETDWRMELRGRPETAQGRMRVTTGRLNHEGAGRYRASILGVADRDRACFQAWLNSRNKIWVGMPVEVDDGFRATSRVASAAETRAALRRMEERRASLARSMAERSAPNRAAFAQPPAPAASPPPVAPVPTVQARVVAHAPGVTAGWSPSAQPGDPLPQRKPTPPRDPSALHRGVNLRIDEVAGQLRYIVRYVDRRRYADDWSQNIQYGAVVLETPLAVEVGSAVELVLINPIGRAVTLMAVVISGTPRSTCVAVLLSDEDNIALKP